MYRPRGVGEWVGLVVIVGLIVLGVLAAIGLGFFPSAPDGPGDISPRY